MTAMIIAVLVASLLGSLHCAGMCGAFVALVSGAGETGWRSAAAAQTAYHLGRLVSYVILGALAGSAGKLIDAAGSMAGFGRAAAVAAGAMMVAFSVITLLRSMGVRIGHLALPASWTRLVSLANAGVMKRQPLVRAATIGLCTTLLPCGWLYAFAVTAAGTGAALSGAATMAVFWIGTAPALVVVSAGVRGLLGPIGRRAPAITSMLLVLVGLYTLLGRSALDPIAMAQRATTQATTTCCIPEK